MWTILLTLCLGFFIGRLKLIPQRFRSITSWITTSGLIILLMSMGAGLSSNPELLTQIGKLGLRALAFAFASISGGIFLVYIIQQILFKPKGADEQ